LLQWSAFHSQKQQRGQRHVSVQNILLNPFHLLFFGSSQAMQDVLCVHKLKKSTALKINPLKAQPAQSNHVINFITVFLQVLLPIL